jgi:glycogen operon protein
MLAGLRRDHPVFRRRRFFRGRPEAQAEAEGDIIWLTPAGQEMTSEDWAAGYAKSLAVFLNGEAISEPDPRGEKITDARFLLLFNAHSSPVTFTLPEAALAPGWEAVIDTAGEIERMALAPKSSLEVPGRAVVVLRSTD